MVDARVWLLALGLFAVSGCTDLSATAAEPVPAAMAPDGSKVQSVSWTGFVLHSATDALMHTAPTEGVLWPYEQAGVVIDIPEGVEGIEIAVAWKGSGNFQIHLHSHNKEHEYVGHRSMPGQGTQNPHCIRVPLDDVAPGKWMVMIHSGNAVQTEFTMTVLTQAVTPSIVDERHGHDRANELLFGQPRQEHEPEPCTMWAASA